MAKRVYTQVFCVVGTIVVKDDKILLIREAGTIDKGKWNLPAGWLDLGENPIDGAKREAKEETGLDIKITDFLGIYSLVRLDLQKVDGFIRHPIKLIFIGKINGEKIDNIDNEEIAEVKWFSLSEIEKMSKNELRDMDIKDQFKDCLAGKQYSLEIIKHTIRK
ncbi:MAG: NUDIX hydrolase [Patescibacteria group bacterium]|jgi:ADP-ribose pyrophosphatase YjhB (NUDIX family)